MDINEEKIRHELSSFLSSLQKLLPKKKEIFIIEKPKPKLIRLTDIHAEAKNVFPNCFAGAKLVVLREVMDRVKLFQQYNFGKPKDSYKCFAHYIHKELDQKNLNEGLLVDSSGSATATYTEVDGPYRFRLTSRIKDLVSSETESVIEKEQENCIGSISFSMKDVNPETVRFVTQWTYKVLPELTVGSEVNFRPLRPSAPILFSFNWRYEIPALTFSSTIGRTGIQACFFKQFTPDLQMSMIVNERPYGPFTLGLGVLKKYQNGSELKVFVDSQQCGGFTFQKDVLFYEPHNEVRVLRLVWSTLIDRQRRVRIGVGFNLDF